MNANFVEHFSGLKDSRIERKKLHALPDILAFVVCAMISGAEAGRILRRLDEANWTG